VILLAIGPFIKHLFSSLLDGEPPVKKVKAEAAVDTQNGD